MTSHKQNYKRGKITKKKKYKFYIIMYIILLLYTTSFMAALINYMCSLFEVEFKLNWELNSLKACFYNIYLD